MFKKEDMYVYSRIITLEIIQPSRLQVRLYFLMDANLEPKSKSGSIGLLKSRIYAHRYIQTAQTP